MYVAARRHKKGQLSAQHGRNAMKNVLACQDVPPFALKTLRKRLNCVFLKAPP